MPFGSIFRWLNLEPIIVLQFVRLDVSNDGFEFFLEPVLPLLIFGSCVNGEKGNFGGRLLNRAHHVEPYNYTSLSNSKKERALKQMPSWLGEDVGDMIFQKIYQLLFNIKCEE